MVRYTQPGMSKKPEKVYPSPFGSHQSMVDNKLTGGLNTPGLVVLRDAKGPYVTHSERLDNGIADPNRHNSIEARDNVEAWIEYLQMFYELANGRAPAAIA
jgi:hypothetical protein